MATITCHLFNVVIILVIYLLKMDKTEGELSSVLVQFALRLIP